jgi:hypothetical protein
MGKQRKERDTVSEKKRNRRIERERMQEKEYFIETGKRIAEEN